MEKMAYLVILGLGKLITGYKVFKALVAFSIMCRFLLFNFFKIFFIFYSIGCSV